MYLTDPGIDRPASNTGNITNTPSSRAGCRCKPQSSSRLSERELFAGPDTT